MIKAMFKSCIPSNAKERLIQKYKKSKGCIWLEKRECSVGKNVVGYRCYDQNGLLVQETPVKNNLKHGIECTWYEDTGKIALLEPYSNGMVHGMAKQWDHNGDFLGSYALKYGTGCDIWRGRREDGSIYVAEIMCFKQGKQHGYSWFFNENQTSVSYEHHFMNGFEHGIQRMWKARNKIFSEYPRYFIKGKRVTKPQYITASLKDRELPEFKAQDQKWDRRFSRDIERILKKYRD